MPAGCDAGLHHPPAAGVPWCPCAHMYSAVASLILHASLPQPNRHPCTHRITQRPEPAAYMHRSFPTPAAIHITQQLYSPEFQILPPFLPSKIRQQALHHTQLQTPPSRHPSTVFLLKTLCRRILHMNIRV